EVGGEGGGRLADAVDAVLRLPVVARHPVEVVEDDVGGGGQVDAHAGGGEVAHQEADGRVALEGVHRRLAPGGRIRAGDGHGDGAEPLGQGVDHGRVGGEHHRLVPAFEDVGHQFGGGRRLGHGQGVAGPVEEAEEGDPGRPAPGRVGPEVVEGPALEGEGPVDLHLHGQPG